MRPKHVFSLVAACLSLLLTVVVATVFFRAGHALSAASSSHAAALRLPFVQSAYGPAPNPGFEPVATPARYTHGVLLEDTFYLAGPSGLALFAPDGTLRRTLRPGLELPVAPVTGLAIARLRSAPEPQLLLSTAGAGLLLLTPRPFALTQVLPQSPELADLSTLLPLSTGEVLLGTRHHGLLSFDGSTLTRSAIPATDVTALAAPTASTLLVGTRTQGAFYARGGTVTPIQNLPDPDIESIVATPALAYLGTPRGVAQLDLATGAVTRTLAPNLFAHALALTPAANPDTLEVGTFDGGVVPIPLTPHLRPASIAAPPFATAANQRVDTFLTPSDVLADGALLHRTGTTWAPALPPAQTLTDANISALAFTPSGQLYIGFFDHGLDILDPEQAPATGTHKHLESDSLFCINRLVLDPAKGTVAAATADGLVLFDAAGTPRQTLTRRDGLLADHVNDLAFTPSGPVVATAAGLTFFTPSGPESLYSFEGLVNNHVYTLATGGNDLLAGTLGGLSILGGDRVRRNFTVTNSTLKHNWITALAPTAPGTYLVGTYGAGLATLSPSGVFTPVDLPADTPRDLVINSNALLVTSTHIYAGTLGHGLLVFSNTTGRWRNVTNGLPSLNVTAFAARAGTLYIGTENGLVRIEEARL